MVTNCRQLFVGVHFLNAFFTCKPEFQMSEQRINKVLLYNKYRQALQNILLPWHMTHHTDTALWSHSHHTCLDTPTPSPDCTQRLVECLCSAVVCPLYGTRYLSSSLERTVHFVVHSVNSCITIKLFSFLTENWEYSQLLTIKMITGTTIRKRSEILVRARSTKTLASKLNYNSMPVWIFVNRTHNLKSPGSNLV